MDVYADASFIQDGGTFAFEGDIYIWGMYGEREQPYDSGYHDVVISAARSSNGEATNLSGSEKPALARESSAP